MKRVFVYFAIASFLSTAIVACKKSSSSTNSSAITVANISGTYTLTDLHWLVSGNDFDIYDSIPACERDNLIKLNADLSANFIDAGIVCSPPEDSTGVWALSGDSLYYSGTGVKIKSFNGKTLVLTGYITDNGRVDSAIIGTSTFAKQ